MSTHEPISPTAVQVDWEALLREFEGRTRGASTERRSGALPIGWMLHAWAGEALDSAAIRIDGSEGLIGPAPARWRLVCYVDEPGFALAVLYGRAPLRPDNVLASLLVAPDRPAIVGVRGRRPNDVPTQAKPGQIQGIATPTAALAAIVDLALGRVTRISGSTTALPSALRLAAALALEQRACGFASSAPPRRGNRRVRAFAASRDPASLRRQLGAAEAALRKRGRGR